MGGSIVDTKETRYLNLFSTVVALILFVLVWLITDYQVSAYNQQEKQKVAVLSKQIASRLEVFFASRTRALDEIATNWPESHPNRQLWFTSFALSVHGVLPLHNCRLFNAHKNFCSRVTRSA